MDYIPGYAVVFGVAAFCLAHDVGLQVPYGWMKRIEASILTLLLLLFCTATEIVYGFFAVNSPAHDFWLKGILLTNPISPGTICLKLIYSYKQSTFHEIGKMFGVSFLISFIGLCLHLAVIVLVATEGHREWLRIRKRFGNYKYSL
ncbi:hypothetical protein CAEBREN_07812 [Caenorhabditis brenneri]|uniref:Uncharacterized protein n=1 Tax=Caenorhabditis brenneri TaxID=135651 RepID=G0MBR1_CAEBE|nr:hypothetical protein CAEBREN_07812 [Caenorhabditis brenneri]